MVSGGHEEICAAASSAAGFLSDVVALVHCCAPNDSFTSDALHSKLRQLGARTASRINKDVTHVIFQRKLHPSAQERAAEDADLRAIYERVPKVLITPRRKPGCIEHRKEGARIGMVSMAYDVRCCAGRASSARRITHLASSMRIEWTACPGMLVHDACMHAALLTTAAQAVLNTDVHMAIPAQAQRELLKLHVSRHVLHAHQQCLHSHASNCIQSSSSLGASWP